MKRNLLRFSLVVLNVLTGLSSAGASSPPRSEFVASAKQTSIGRNVVSLLKPFLFKDPDCSFKFEKVTDLSTKKSKSTVYTLGIKLESNAGNCTAVGQNCINIKVVVSKKCSLNPTQKCLKLIDEKGIQCIPEYLAAPIGKPSIPPFVRSLPPIQPRDTDASSNKEVIKIIAQEATNFLYHFFDTRKPCPIYLEEIMRSSEKAGKGYTYTIDMQLSTNAVDFDCEFVIKQCNNVQVYQPSLLLCPNEDPCLIPVQLDKVKCFDIPQTVSATSPPFKIYEPISITDKAKYVANKVLDQMIPYVPLKPGCNLKINQIYDVSAYEGDVTVYKYELNLGSDNPKCKLDSKICKNVKVFLTAPEYCDEPDGECFNLFETRDIECFPDIIVDPPEIMTDDTPFGSGHIFREVPSPHNNFIIKQIAQEASKFLYSQIDTSRVCPLYLKDIIRAKESVNKGIYYDLEFQVNTNSVDFNCEFKILNCNNVRVHQPSYNLCPGQRFCLVPVKIQDINCIELPQIFH